MSADSSQRLIASLEAEFAQSQPAQIDTSSASALAHSLAASVIPALQTRQGRLVDAIQRFNSQANVPYEHAQQRLAYERAQMELLQSLAPAIGELAPVLDAVDVAELASTVQGALAGQTDAPALGAVRVVVRGKARLGRISQAVAEIVLLVLETQQTLEREVMRMSQDLSRLTQDGGQPPPELVQRIVEYSDAYRDLSVLGSAIEASNRPLDKVELLRAAHELRSVIAGAHPRAALQVLAAIRA